jgi:hypothetical protein
MLKLFKSDKPTPVLLVYSQTPIECVYCHTPIKTENVVVRCPICRTIHHPECWKDGGGCAVFGCKKAPKDKK